MINEINNREVAWIYSEQKDERDLGNPIGESDLILSLANDWDTSQGVPDAWEGTEEEINKAMDNRNELITKYEEFADRVAVKINLGDIEASISYGQIAEKLRQYPRPQYLCVNCHRRGMTFPAVEIARELLGREALFDVPLMVNNKFANNPDFRLHARLAENSRIGRRPYSANNQLVLATRLIRLGVNARGLMPKLNVKDTVAQKLYTWGLLCRKFDGLLTRSLMPTDENTRYSEGGPIPWRKIPGGHCYALLGLAKSLTDSNKPVYETMGHFNFNMPATEVQIERYIKEILFGDKARLAKVMDRKTIGNFRDMSAISELRVLLDGIVQNDNKAVSDAMDMITFKIKEYNRAKESSVVVDNVEEQIV